MCLWNQRAIGGGAGRSSCFCAWRPGCLVRCVPCRHGAVSRECVAAPPRRTPGAVLLVAGGGEGGGGGLHARPLSVYPPFEGGSACETSVCLSPFRRGVCIRDLCLSTPLSTTPLPGIDCTKTRNAAASRSRSGVRETVRETGGGVRIRERKKVPISVRVSRSRRTPPVRFGSRFAVREAPAHR